MQWPVMKIVSPGLRASLEDNGRSGWRKFGVPAGGVMDAHAAHWANRLLDNPADTPVIELLLQGAQLLALRDVWLAIAGADAGCALPIWRSAHVLAGGKIEFT